VPLAPFVVKSLPLTALRWLVIVVVVYAAVLMLRSARQETLTRQATAAQEAPLSRIIERSEGPDHPRGGGSSRTGNSNPPYTK